MIFFYPITTETITCLILFSDREAKIRKNYGGYDVQATLLQSRERKKMCESELLKTMEKNMQYLDNGLLRVEEIVKNIIMQQKSK